MVLMPFITGEDEEKCAADEMALHGGFYLILRSNKLAIMPATTRTVQFDGAAKVREVQVGWNFAPAPTLYSRFLLMKVVVVVDAVNIKSILPRNCMC